MTFVPFIAAAAGGGLLGLVFYEGLNQSPAGVASGDPVTARTEFLARLDAPAEESFELFANLSSVIDDSGLNPGVYEPDPPPSTIAITLNGITWSIVNTYSDSPNNSEPTYGRYGSFGVLGGNSWIVGSNVAGRFATHGTKHLVCAATTPEETGLQVTITFDAPIAFFGAYMTDIGDGGGKVSYRLTKVDTSTVSGFVSDATSLPDGSLLFWGFVDDTDTYTKIEFFCTRPSGTDVWGVDQLTWGPASMVVT